ncbi:MAG: flavodoxin domain-containing protein [Tannerella sp.]|jgi:menaquinone-dependent protoporphyrinogen oxidase|nr:flavodoxin domain-containing protein [Tannerella sp.]
MRTAIIYASKHGTTAKVAQKIAERFPTTESVAVYNLKTDKQIDIQSFDTVVLGTAVYAGKPLPAMQNFCERQSGALLNKHLGLFVCGMEQDANKQQQETTNAFPHVLREKALAAQFLGGEFLFDRMNFLERLIIKKIAKTDQNVSAIKETDIEEFVKKFKEI